MGGLHEEGFSAHTGETATAESAQAMAVVARQNRNLGVTAPTFAEAGTKRSRSRPKALRLAALHGMNQKGPARGVRRLQ